MLYIIGTVLLTVYGQLILKWRVSQHILPSEFSQKFIYLSKLVLTDFFVLSGFAAAFLASLCWMTAIKNMNLSTAYPFMSLSFILVVFLSAIFFNEKISYFTVLGLMLICAGIAVVNIGK